jgi:hypothetical protein
MSRTPSQPTTPKLSALSLNLIMEPGTTPADLHRNPDATGGTLRFNGVAVAWRKSWAE